MRRHLVPGLGDGLNQARVSLRNPPQDEERRLTMFLLEHGQEPLRRLLHPALDLVPVAPPHRRVERRYVEVLFDVKRETVNRVHGQIRHTLPAPSEHIYLAPFVQTTTRIVSRRILKSRASERFLR